MTEAIINAVSETEQAEAISVLTLAFSTDPMSRWSLPDPVKYLKLFPSVARAFGGTGHSVNAWYIAEDCSGAAMWLPPGMEGDGETLERIFMENAPQEIMGDLPSLFEQMTAFHPTEPHWYLPMIGVDPARQGKGTGSALMKAALTKVDDDGLIAYLESSNEKNIPLYERHGFEVIGRIQSGSSPVLYPMLRKASK